MGWVDLESSPGWWAATVDAYCPSRMVEHPKSKSTQPMYLTVGITLYSTNLKFSRNSAFFLLPCHSGRNLFYERLYEVAFKI